MQVAIISDIHDNLVNLKTCLTWCNKNKIKKLICLGDITNSDTLKYLATKFTEQIYLVKGNIELYPREDLKKYKNIKYFNKIGKIIIGNKNIGFCHEDYLVKKLLAGPKCNIIFYGHTHKPWEEEKNNIKIINPGTLSGMFQIATFAIMNTENGEAKLKALDMLNTPKSTDNLIFYK